MKEFIDKLIRRLEEKKNKYQDLADGSNFDGWHKEDIEYTARTEMCEEILDIVNQLAEEYKVSEMPTGSEDYCEWVLIDYEANVYDTTCRNPHILLEGSPTDNSYEFCPYCGKKIKVAPYTEGE